MDENWTLPQHYQGLYHIINPSPFIFGAPRLVSLLRPSVDGLQIKANLLQTARVPMEQIQPFQIQEDVTMDDRSSANSGIATNTYPLMNAHVPTNDNNAGNYFTLDDGNTTSNRFASDGAIDHVEELKQLLQAPKTNEFLGIIKSADQYWAYEEAFQSISNQAISKEANHNDGLPRDDTEHMALRKMIFEAITDFGNVIEKESGAKVQRVQALSNIEVELLSYRILEQSMMAHQGCPAISAWQRDTAPHKRDWRFEEFATFRDRFAYVLEVCRVGHTPESIQTWKPRLICSVRQEQDLGYGGDTHAEQSGRCAAPRTRSKFFLFFCLFA